MDPPENSSFNEVTSTLSVWGDVDRLETAASTRTEKTDGAWRTVAITSAKGLANASLGANPKSTPPKRSGDHEFRDAVHTGHQKGSPRLE
jgi:hypothetical protein